MRFRHLSLGVRLVVSSFVSFLLMAGFVRGQADWRPHAPSKLGDSQMAFHADLGVVVMFGGTSEADSGGAETDQTWIWRGAQWELESHSVSPPARQAGAMAYDSVKGVIVLFAGSNGTSGFLNDTWIWDGQWTEVQCPAEELCPSARNHHTMAFDPMRGKVLLFGGDGPTSRLNDLWEFDTYAESWTQLESLPAAGRGSPTMAYHAGRGTMVVYGGSVGGPTGTATGETWEYDHSQAESNPWGSLGVAPFARVSAEMVFDPLRDRLVVVGGFDEVEGLPADTWEWDDALAPHGTWTSFSAAPHPAGRWAPALTFDAARGEIVLYGGFLGTGSGAIGESKETWIRNGTAWASKAGSPPASGGAVLAYDRMYQMMIMAGGDGTPPGGFDRTWSFDAEGWADVTPSSPTPGLLSSLPGFAYNELDKRIVCFAGFQNGSVSNQTWEWDGATMSLGVDDAGGRAHSTRALQHRDGLRSPQSHLRRRRRCEHLELPERCLGMGRHDLEPVAVDTSCSGGQHRVF